MIDWEKQWEQHARNFEHGFLHLKAGENLVRLKPGPGFGDMSHPTTRLMLAMMQDHIIGRYVFDVGCGSGILGIAAASMGAKRVWAIDIDPDAIEHARMNVALNGLQNKMEVGKTFPNTDQPVALMNMIWTEQKQAWPNVDEFITSGILKEEKVRYIAWLEEQGFNVIGISEEEGWCGFYFKKEAKPK